MNRWMNASEVGVMLGIGKETVQRRAKDGRLPQPRVEGSQHLWDRTEIEQIVFGRDQTRFTVARQVPPPAAIDPQVYAANNRGGRP